MMMLRAQVFPKRALDVLLSAILLVVLLPLSLLTAIAIWFADPGPIFFRQVREGINGVPFVMLKFRTMYRNASDILDFHLRANLNVEREWRAYLCLRDDPRLIRIIGPFLRRFSIDELPQLWNVLQGTMSLVGPRPFALDHVIYLEPALRRKRLAVLPGITGLWQISGRGDVNLHRLQLYDILYVRRHSFSLDLWILWRTIPAVWRGKGAY